MMRLLVAFVFALCAAIGVAAPARANTCTVPNTLSNGVVVDANVLNTNFVSLQSCGNNIDSTNVGPAGILASQIIASSAAAGTFGGTYALSFTHGINVTGSVNSTGEAAITVAGSPLLQSLTGNAYLRSPGASGTIYFGDSATAGRYGTFTPSGLSAAAGGLFQTATAASTIGVGVAASSAYPTLANSGDGGSNAIVASSSTLGSRWFKYDGTTLTQVGQLDNSGNFTTGSGNYYAPAGIAAQICANANCATSGLTVSTAGQVSAPSLNISGGGSFGGALSAVGALSGASANLGSGVGSIGLASSAFSATVPEVIADGSGGFNFSIASTDTYGYRFFKYDGTTLTQLAQLTNAGLFSALNITSSGNFISGNGVVTAGGTNPLQLCASNTCANAVQVSAAGQLSARSASGANATYVAPIYTVTGGAVSATEHSVYGNGSITIASGSGSQVVIFTGAAIFASTAYYCGATPTGNPGTVVIGMTYGITATNSVTFYMQSPSGSGVTGYSWSCTGP